MKIKTLVIDDEPLARERIFRMLSNETDIEIVGESGNGAEAISLIREREPDLVFLDIQMPEMNGFEVLETIVPQQIPAIIFVTAYDQYAIRAFDFHALDYLLKPFNRERFSSALNRAREQVNKKNLDERSEMFVSLLTDLKARKEYLEKIILRSEGRIYFLKTEEIDWIEASGNYIKIHVGKESHLLRETMNSIETRLDPNKFSRIHRSTIVNSDRIKELYPLFNGDYTLILKDKTELILSRSYRNRLLD